MCLLPSLLRTGGLISLNQKRAGTIALKIGTFTSNNKNGKLFAFSTKKRSPTNKDRSTRSPQKQSFTRPPQQQQQQQQQPALSPDSFSSGITASVLLVRGKDRLFQEAGNPIVYGGAVASVDGDPQAGSEVWVKNQDGAVFARGFFNPYSQYRVRIISSVDLKATGDGTAIKQMFNMTLKELLIKRIAEALQLPSKNTNVYRLVNGEGDRLGGLMVDVIGPVVVVQSSAYWVEKNAALIRQVLEELLLSSSTEEEMEQGGDDGKKKTIIWRRSESRLKQDGYTGSGSSAVGGNMIPIEEDDSDSDSDNDDDSDSVNSSSGSLGSDSSEDDDVVVWENGLRFLCGPESDQKTGFYCDQRDTRFLIRSLSAGCTVLDAYCYSGGFSLNAVYGGAVRATALDSSARALSSLEKNIQLNELDRDRFELIPGDAVKTMTTLVSKKRVFDVVICDPPKLAPTRAGLAKATNKYKQINTLAMRLVKPGGLLLSCTCSAAMTQALPPVGGFESMLFAAAKAAQRDVTVLRSAGAGSDHPVLLSYPE
eukprot:gene27669-36419_t